MEQAGDLATTLTQTLDPRSHSLTQLLLTRALTTHVEFTVNEAQYMHVY